MSADAVIQIRNLSKIYRDFWGRKKVKALNSLSLDIHKGEVFGLLGPNGSGKTTTMKLLLGLLFPTEGEITIPHGESDARVDVTSSGYGELLLSSRTPKRAAASPCHGALP